MKIQHIEYRTRFLIADVDKFSNGKYDLIVSNPPYIKKHSLKYLQEDVNLYEPKLALDGGCDGFSKIETLIKKSSVLLKNNGKMIIEIDSNISSFLAFSYSNEIVDIYNFEDNKFNNIIFNLESHNRTAYILNPINTNIFEDIKSYGFKINGTYKYPIYNIIPRKESK